ncbi:hypothetical protein [Brevibacillus brevis]|uniref:hypothetical protein n=1 Tax=Brevibacillus brevis TaxID=1393 RepID=UPI0037CA3614
MSYTVQSSEKLRKKASDTETKALLYLMNFCDDSNEIHYFVVDFFNDLTGMDRFSRKLWDLQSKGASNSSPGAVGRELVTLFKNYCSNFAFHKYILFLGGVSDALRIDSTKDIFDTSNITTKALTNLKKGLKDECIAKTYIDTSSATDEKIDDFLSKVLFVIDNKTPSEYVKSIIKIHPGIMPDEHILNGIFNEIRDTQASKKNINVVEGITIETTDQALNYYRHLTNGEIKLFVLGRIINRNPFAQGCPLPFIPIYNQFPEEKRQEALDDCKLALSRALFNKNCADNFWRLFSNIYHFIVANPTYGLEAIYQNLDMTIATSCPDFDVLSLKYFISTVREGIKT